MIGNILGFLLFLVLLLLKWSVILPLRWLFKWRSPRDPRDLEKTYWENVRQNQFASVREVVRPKDKEELVAILREAYENGWKARAVGSGHSFSDVAVTDGVCIDLHAMRGVIDEHLETCRIRVQAGISIHDLNEELKRRGLALPNMGGYDIQTISGAISTATHGSGIDFGTLADYVLDIEILKENGDAVVLAPSSGEEGLAFGDVDRNDDRFYAAVVAMGCMGIVYAYTLKVRKAFLLEESRTLLQWEQVKIKLLEGALQKGSSKEALHYEVLVNPYLTNGKRWCLVTTRKEVKTRSRTWHGRTRAPIATLLTSIRVVDDALLWLVIHVPTTLKWLNSSALKSLADKQYVEESFKVFNLGDANFVPAVSSELAFEVIDGKGGRYIDAVEKLFLLADQLAKHGHWHSAPISLRFVKASEHFLAPQYRRDTCMLEIPLLAGDPAAFHILRYYERIFIEQFGARPHWGQAHFLVGAENVRRLYPRFDDWASLCARLNPKRTFENVFTQRLGLQAQSSHVERIRRPVERETAEA
jgi:hypothetical protein